MLDQSPRLARYIIAPDTDVVHAGMPRGVPDGSASALQQLDVLRPLRRIGEPQRNGRLAHFWQPHALVSVLRLTPRDSKCRSDLCHRGIQIQNRGTLGGNIASAAPTGSPCPASSTPRAAADWLRQYRCRPGTPDFQSSFSSVRG